MPLWHKKGFFLWVLVAVLLSFSLMSCEKSHVFQKSKDKASYIESYQSMSLEEQKKLLKEDVADVDSLLELAEGLQMYYSLSFSAGSASGKQENPVLEDTVKAFRIQVDESAAKADFDSAIQNAEIHQDFRLPKSQIGIKISGEKKYVRISEKASRFFRKGKAVDTAKLGLQYLDSIQAQVSYRYPKSMREFIIDKKPKGNVSLMGEVMEIDSWKGNEASFRMPITLYARLLSFQAYNKDGVLMNPNANSAFPATVVKSVVKQSLVITRKLMFQASLSKNNKELVGILQRIPPQIFAYKSSLTDLEEEMEAEEKQNTFRAKKTSDDLESGIGFIKKIMEKYSDVLAPEIQIVDMAFPDAPEKIVMYFGSDYQTLEKEVTVKNTIEAPLYTTFYDEKKKKYGIVDHQGNIIIDAELTKPLQYIEKDFFMDRDATYRIFPKEKRFQKYPHLTYTNSIGKDLVIMKDSLSRYGVIKGEDTEILPFIYKDVKKMGNSLVVSQKVIGKTRYAIFSQEGKKLLDNIREIQPHERENKEENMNFIVIFADGKRAIIDKNAKYLLKPEYRLIDWVGDKSVFSYFNPDNHLYGVMEATGKRLSPPIFSSVALVSGDRVFAELPEKNAYDLFDLSGKLIPSVSFLDVNPFYQGYAVVETQDERLVLIDKNGKIVKEMPKHLGDFKYVTEENRMVEYVFEKGTISQKDLLNTSTHE